MDGIIISLKREAQRKTKMAKRITKELKVLNKENVITILTMFGYNEESAIAKVEAGYDVAVRSMPEATSKDIADFLATCY